MRPYRSLYHQLNSKLSLFHPNSYFGMFHANETLQIHEMLEVFKRYLLQLDQHDLSYATNSLQTEAVGMCYNIFEKWK